MCELRRQAMCYAFGVNYGRKANIVENTTLKQIHANNNQEVLNIVYNLFNKRHWTIK